MPTRHGDSEGKTGSATDGQTDKNKTLVSKKQLKNQQLRLVVAEEGTMILYIPTSYRLG